MKLTKFGHSCMLVEEGDARILIDPGMFSAGYEDLERIDVVLVTHQHGDHVAPETLAKVRAKNPDVQVRAEAETAAMLGEAGVSGIEIVKAGDEFAVKGARVQVFGESHAIIHPAIPGIGNVGYMIGGRFFYPGDKFTNPGVAVEILGMPLGAPWLKVAEVVDYVLALKPKLAVPMHDAVLAMPDMHINIVRNLTKDSGVEVRVIENGTSAEL